MEAFGNSKLFDQLIFVYRNWKGEIRERRVTPIRIEYSSNAWHDEPQWFLVAFDEQKGEPRHFAIEDIIGNIRHVRRRDNVAKQEVMSAEAVRRKREREQSHTTVIAEHRLLEAPDDQRRNRKRVKHSSD